MLEREQTAAAQEAGRFRHHEPGIRPPERAVVTADDVEALVRKRHGLGARMHEREVDTSVDHRAARMLELVFRVVQSDSVRPTEGE